MKKIFIALSALILTLGLCACRSQTAESEEFDLEPISPIIATPSVEELMAASESDAEILADDTLPLASDTDAELDESAYETALQYVGQPVEALYEVIGEPSSAQYAASCLEDGAEDGMLFYGGFYLWTIRGETEELIHAVYLMD